MQFHRSRKNLQQSLSIGLAQHAKEFLVIVVRKLGNARNQGDRRFRKFDILVAAIFRGLPARDQAFFQQAADQFREEMVSGTCEKIGFTDFSTTHVQ